MPRFTITLNRKQIYVEAVTAEVEAKDQKKAERSVVKAAKEGKLEWAAKETLVANPRIIIESVVGGDEAPAEAAPAETPAE